MNTTQISQVYLFGIYILSGIIIGLLFDFFRILRKSFKTPDFLTYIEDFLFWIITGIIILTITFIFNNGEIRGFSIIGISLGILLYILMLSKHIIKAFVFVILFIKKIIVFPIKKCQKLIKKRFIKKDF